MIRTFFWYFLGWAYLVCSVPIMWRVIYLDKRGKSEQRDRLVYKHTMKGAKFLFNMTGSKIVVRGEENIPKDKAVLFVSNHQGHMDSAIINGFINVPKGFVSIVEVDKFPILRTWMRYMKCVFLDRSDPRQSLECLNKGMEFLRNGHSMVIFPEGKLSGGSEVGEFRSGSLRLALKTGTPIVPITIKDSYKIMSKLGTNVRAADVECIISKPIETSSIDRNGEKELMKLVRDTIIEKF